MTLALMALALLTAADVAAAPGSEDGDLALIPELPNVPGPSPPPASPTSRFPQARLYLEDAFTLAARREPLVPLPPPLPYRWQNRLSIDAQVEGLPRPSLKLVLSDRFDVVAQEDVALWSHSTPRNELREAYAAWQPRPRLYFEAGRINVRNGVALGFNPIDVFRPRTLVGQASLDPSVLSRNRLGTLMVRGQAIGDRGAITLAWAPGLFQPSPLTRDAIGVDPRLDATNATNRLFASVSANLSDVSGQAVAYHEPGRSKAGLALTRPLGQSVIAYAEVALGHEASLLARALDFGQQTKTLPAGAAPPIPGDLSPAWRTDAAAGASWTVARTLTVNLEYHFHQGALTATDWDRWFDTGRAEPALGPQLWYVRAYAADQLEPASQHNAFVRLAWPDIGRDELELDCFAFVNLRDGSALTQVTAIYQVSDRWTFTLAASINAGSAQSERGSLPQVASVIGALVLYL